MAPMYSALLSRCGGNVCTRSRSGPGTNTVRTSGAAAGASSGAADTVSTIDSGSDDRAISGSSGFLMSFSLCEVSVLLFL